MGNITVISPEEIKKGDSQNITADLSKFDIAGAQTDLAVQSLVPYESIKSTEEQNNALAAMKLANAVSKAIEERRTVLVKPFNEAVKKINAYAKDLTGKIDTKVGTIKTVVLQFQKDEEAKALKLRTEKRIEALESIGFIKNESQKSFSREDVGTLSFSEITSLDDTIFSTILEGFNNKIKENAEKALKEIEQEDELFDVFGSDEDKAEVSQKVEEAKAVVSAPASAYTGSVGPSKLKGTTKTWVHEITNEADVPREYMMVDDAKIKAAIKEGMRSIPGVRIYQKESLTLR